MTTIYVEHYYGMEFHVEYDTPEFSSKSSGCLITVPGLRKYNALVWITYTIVNEDDENSGPMYWCRVEYPKGMFSVSLHNEMQDAVSHAIDMMQSAIVIAGSSLTYARERRRIQGH